MRPSFPTLAGILKEHGYATGGVINAPALKPSYGVDRGFDHYHMTPAEGRIADGTTRDALEWIDSTQGRPFFAFVHYFDPHLSYSPPSPYDRMFGPDYQGRIGNSFNLEGFSRVRDTMFVQLQDLSTADWNHIESLYDGEIVFADSAIGELLKGLDGRGLRDNTLIVFLSDHGEEFFEHGGFEHGHSLYEELIHVPLIISLPGKLPEGVKLARPVRLLDVAPTILDLVGVERPGHFEGKSLAPLLLAEGGLTPNGSSLLPADVGYAEALMHCRERKSVTAYPWKLIYEIGTEKTVLRNLEQDPGEFEDLIDLEPDRAAYLEGLLLKSQFGMSDTWYLELQAGENLHTFDIEITAERGLMLGNIDFWGFLDADGKVVRHPHSTPARPNTSVLKFKDLEFRGELTLAFRAEPERIPVRFNLAIDGRPATERSYIGPSLEGPGEMPFTVRGHRKRVISPGRPSGHPDPPYALIWHDQSRYRGDTAIKLDEETKKELRALGYIQ